jgi:hypothetical protein
MNKAHNHQKESLVSIANVVPADLRPVIRPFNTSTQKTQ